MAKDLVPQKSIPLHPVDDDDIVNSAAGNAAIMQYVQMLLEEVPGMPVETLRENIEADLEFMAEGETTKGIYIYDWYRADGMLRVRLKK